MGLCSFLFKTTGYVFVALLAIVAYFAYECYGPKPVQECPFNEKFDRDYTDLKDIPIPFTHKGKDSKGHLGFDYIGIAQEWCITAKFVYLISAKTTHKTDPDFHK